jgi:hypothetical protein
VGVVLNPIAPWLDELSRVVHLSTMSLCPLHDPELFCPEMLLYYYDCIDPVKILCANVFYDIDPD